jgi:hypothetical protein
MAERVHDESDPAADSLGPLVSNRVATKMRCVVKPLLNSIYAGPVIRA